LNEFITEWLADIKRAGTYLPVVLNANESEAMAIALRMMPLAVIAARPYFTYFTITAPSVR
jgi:hypothetical protein